MDSIKISTGQRRIAINDDPTRIIEFDPTDVGFAERFYRLLSDLETEQASYKTRSEELDRMSETDASGLPANLPARLALLRDTCEFMRSQIDALFGPGTSQTAFGEARNLEAIAEFFEGMIPFVQTARAEKLEKYAANKKARVMR